MVPGQTCPQEPQFFGSPPVSVLHPPTSQQVCPLPQPASVPSHVHVGLPPTLLHASPDLHAVPLHEQMPLPMLQLAIPTPPRLQAALDEQPQVLFGLDPPSHTKGLAGLPCKVHEFAQPPQFELSCDTFASQPSSPAGAAGVEQLPNPDEHAESQSPALQSSELTFDFEQARPQAPQLATSAERSRSQPSGVCASQLLQNGSHVAMVHIPPAQPDVA